MEDKDPKHGEVWQFRVKGELTYALGFVYLPPGEDDTPVWAKELRVNREGEVKSVMCVMRRKYYAPDKLIGRWDIEPNHLQGIKRVWGTF